MATAGEVTPAELADRLEAGEEVAVLDVRNRDELEAWRIEGAGVDLTHVPYMRFVSAQATGDPASLVDPAASYVVVCPEGEASAEVADALAAAGVEAANLAGGMAAWGRLYRGVELPAPAGTDATVVQYRRPATGCLAYAVVSAGEAMVVDPLAAFAARYADDAGRRGVSLAYALDTHVHADHLSALRELDGVTRLVSEGAAARGIAFDAESVAGGDRLAVGDHELEVLSTPGHTTGAVSLRVEDLLLSGDSLFLEGVPRPDLQAGDADAPAFARRLHETLTDRLAGLPDDVVVAPGHYPPGRPPGEDGTYTARLGALRRRLRAFSEDRETFVERVVASMGAPPANFERIVAANLGRDPLAGEAAFELELGPNNCAVAGD